MLGSARCCKHLGLDPLCVLDRSETHAARSRVNQHPLPSLEHGLLPKSEPHRHEHHRHGCGLLEGDASWHLGQGASVKCCLRAEHARGFHAHAKHTDSHRKVQVGTLLAMCLGQGCNHTSKVCTWQRHFSQVCSLVREEHVQQILKVEPHRAHSHLHLLLLILESSESWLRNDLQIS